MKTFNSIPLTKREREIANYLVSGETCKEIAQILYIQPETVRFHVKNIYKKIGVHSRVELVNRSFFYVKNFIDFTHKNFETK